MTTTNTIDTVTTSATDNGAAVPTTAPASKGKGKGKGNKGKPPATLPSDKGAAPTTGKAGKGTTAPAPATDASATPKKPKQYGIVDSANRAAERPNMPTAQARVAIVEYLKMVGRADRNELKAAVPHGNYTALMGSLVADGTLDLPSRREGERLACYQLAGSNGLPAKAKKGKVK